MDEVVRLAPGALVSEEAVRAPVTYHSFCQSANVLGMAAAPRRLLRDVAGFEIAELPEGTVCCGFGGSTSAMNPEVAAQILDRKLENVVATGAGVLVTDNPGCIMHLRGGIDAKGLPVRVMHIAEVLAGCLPE
jgi:Fe-S oxidoreductase